MNHLLDRLYQHLAWADREVMEALAKASEPPAEALQLLGHILAAERIWLAHIRHEEPAGLTVWPESPTLDQCRQRLAENRAGYQALVATLQDADMEAPVAYRTTHGESFENNLEDILLHVALHGTHHRGQIAALARRAGLDPARTDYIMFVRS